MRERLRGKRRSAAVSGFPGQVLPMGRGPRQRTGALPGPGTERPESNANAYTSSAPSPATRARSSHRNSPSKMIHILGKCAQRSPPGLKAAPLTPTERPSSTRDTRSHVTSYKTMVWLAAKSASLPVGWNAAKRMGLVPERNHFLFQHSPDNSLLE